ncbi:MAG TPA: PKD domain-containing protein [Polyangiaceae bacterium]|nr:PKD domain-containing protein [Polyangiaceae bacterium]
MKRSKVAQAVARIGSATLLIGLAACGQSASGSSPTPAGEVGSGLQLAPGVTVTEATYAISGPNDFFSAGNVGVGESADLVVPVGTLPQGSGYELSLTAPASDGQTVCNGNAVFDVTDGNPKSVNVHLSCAVPSGDVSVSATLNICPMIDSLGASPNDVKLGGTIALTSAAHDSDASPSPLSYKWAINGAPLPPQMQPNLNFVCSQPGTFNFTLSVSDGDITPGCADTLSVSARCSAP